MGGVLGQLKTAVGVGVITGVTGAGIDPLDGRGDGPGVVGGCSASVSARVVSWTVCANSSFRAVMLRLKLGDFLKASKGVA